MKVVTIDQNSEDWLSWRKNGLGASDISVVSRSNTFETPRSLWEKKCGFKENEFISAAMKHGHNCEPLAREWVNKHYQMHLIPICLEEEETPYFRASLDGFDFDSKTLVEIKSPISEKTIKNARISGSYHKYWWDQMQWQIMLCQPTRAFLAIWDYKHECCIMLEVWANIDRITKLRELGKEFWKCVKAGYPPEVESADFQEVNDDDLFNLFKEYEQLHEKITAYQKVEKTVKDKIAKYAKGENVVCRGRKVKWVENRATYDVEKMRMDGIDIDKYKKKTENSAHARIILPRSI